MSALHRHVRYGLRRLCCVLVLAVCAVMIAETAKAGGPPLEPIGGCSLTFAELSDEKLSQMYDSFMEGIRATEDLKERAAQIDALGRRILAQVETGAKATCDQGTGCFQVAYVRVYLFCERNDVEVIADHEFEEGVRGDYEKIQIASVQPRGVEQLGDRTEKYDGELTVHIHWKKTPPDAIDLTAKQVKLLLGETTELTARIECGSDLVKQRDVEFQLEGPGKLSDSSANTNTSGVATIKFTATEEGESVVWGRHDMAHGSEKLRTMPCMWKLEISVDFRGAHESHREEWQMTATVADLPLTPFESEWVTREFFGKITAQQVASRDIVTGEWKPKTIVKGPECELVAFPLLASEPGAGDGVGLMLGMLPSTLKGSWGDYPGFFPGFVGAKVPVDKLRASETFELEATEDALAESMPPRLQRVVRWKIPPDATVKAQLKLVPQFAGATKLDGKNAVEVRDDVGWPVHRSKSKQALYFRDGFRGDLPRLRLFIVSARNQRNRSIAFRQIRRLP